MQISHHIPTRWRPATSTMLVLLGVGWLLVRYLQTRHLGLGIGSDVSLYLRYAQSWGEGSAPYKEFHPEYPPGALLVFLIPYLFSGHHGYSNAFALFMGCFDVAACLLVYLTTKARTGRRMAATVAASVYTLGTAALYPVLYARYDLVPAVVVLAAFYAASRRRNGWAALLVGVAGAVKLWPFALAPLWVVHAYQRRGAWAALQACLFVGAGAVITSLPVLPRAGLSALDFLSYHEQRGIQLETTWSTMALALDVLKVVDVRPEHNFGAFQLAGDFASTLARLSIPAMVIVSMLPTVLYVLRHRDNFVQHQAWVGAVIATVLGFMVSGKVLSPQFMLWAVPLVALVATRTAPALATLGACVLTTWIYPYLSPALEQRAPGHVVAVVVLGTRNLLLLVLYLSLAVRAWRFAATARTAPRL